MITNLADAYLDASGHYDIVKSEKRREEIRKKFTYKNHMKRPKKVRYAYNLNTYLTQKKFLLGARSIRLLKELGFTY